MSRRFPALAPADYSPEQRRLAETLTAGPRGAVRGPYVPLIYSPELADRVRHLGDYIRFEGVLPRKLKEVVIFAAARHWRAAYMFWIHREMSRAVGLDPAVVEAFAAGTAPAGLEPAEQAALAFAEELLRTGRVSEAAFAAVRRPFGAAGAIELTCFVGYYSLLAMVLNAAELPAADG